MQYDMRLRDHHLIPYICGSELGSVSKNVSVNLWLFLTCEFKLPDWTNALSQKWHLKGFSSVCNRIWLFRLPDCVNALSQNGHLKGFSPEIYKQLF